MKIPSQLPDNCLKNAHFSTVSYFEILICAKKPFRIKIEHSLNFQTLSSLETFSTISYLKLKPKASFLNTQSNSRASIGYCATLKEVFIGRSRMPRASFYGLIETT